MFQTILGGQADIEQEELEQNDKRKMFFQKVFTKKNIIVYVVSFILSTIECVNGIAHLE